MSRRTAGCADLPSDGYFPITWMQADGTLTFRGSYDNAVVRLFAYEASGVLPEDAGTGCIRNGWERYTMKTACGEIIPRRGCERIMGRLWAYEASGLAPLEWAEHYGSVLDKK